jgi:hypothetical protein
MVISRAAAHLKNGCRSSFVVRMIIVAALRHAILACNKVELHYRARGSGALSRTLVCPYGFLYGTRHYLVADSLNPKARGFRLFSLANIVRVEPTARAFTRRKNFSLQKFAEARSAFFRRSRSTWSALLPQSRRRGAPVYVSSDAGDGAAARWLAGRTFPRWRRTRNVLAPIHLGRRGRGAGTEAITDHDAAK